MDRVRSFERRKYRTGLAGAIAVVAFVHAWSTEAEVHAFSVGQQRESHLIQSVSHM